MPILALVFVPIFAFAYRARGGAIPLGSTQLARLLFFVLPNILACAFLVSVDWYILMMVAVGAWWGISFGHSKWQDGYIRSYWGMSWITFFRMVLIFAPVALVDHHYLLTPLLFAPSVWVACDAGYRLNADKIYLKAFGITWCDPYKGSEWEEFLIGAVYGSAWVSPLMGEAIKPWLA